MNYGLRLEETPLGQAWLECLETELSQDGGLTVEQIETLIRSNSELIEERFAADINYEAVAETLLQRPLKQPAKYAGPNPCADALAHAIELLDLAHGDKNEKVNATIKMLKAILDQRGCEHVGTDGEDGKLTDLMDAIIFG